jgi:iron-sulfur cluster insertion protein
VGASTHPRRVVTLAQASVPGLAKTVASRERMRPVRRPPVQRKRAKRPYNQSMIHVTETAAEKITALLAEENKLGSGLRVFVQGGGCSGFQYGLMIDEGSGDPESDQVFEVNGVKLLVDPVSLRYLNNAEVDFVDNNMGGGFTIKNPNAKSTCGCGSSFSA